VRGKSRKRGRKKEEKKKKTGEVDQEQSGRRGEDRERETKEYADISRQLRRLQHKARNGYYHKYGVQGDQNRDGFEKGRRCSREEATQSKKCLRPKKGNEKRDGKAVRKRYRGGRAVGMSDLLDYRRGSTSDLACLIPKVKERGKKIVRTGRIALASSGILRGETTRQEQLGKQSLTSRPEPPKRTRRQLQRAEGKGEGPRQKKKGKGRKREGGVKV